jgi:hypothetical protein
MVGSPPGSADPAAAAGQPLGLSPQPVGAPTPTPTQKRATWVLADFLVPRAFPQLSPAADAVAAAGLTAAGLRMTPAGFFTELRALAPVPPGHRFLLGKGAWGSAPALHAAPFIALAVLAALATVFAFRWLLNAGSPAASSRRPWGIPESARGVISQVRSKIAR